MDPPREKKTQGRKKIELKRIENDAARQVSFSKRKKSICKKACELNSLCKAETAAILYSPSGALFSFGEPSVEAVVDRYLEGGAHLHEDAYIRAERDARNAEIDIQYNTAVKRLEDAEKIGKELADIKKADSDPFGWDVPVEELSLEQLERLQFELESLRIIEQPSEELPVISITAAASSSANPLVLSRGSTSSDISNPPPPNDPQGY
ncbi:hypothetical protein MKX01_020746 [Papaver californicum]|nr:hypothetical protein MKX01_020746 [Papaver californicum]